MVAGIASVFTCSQERRKNCLLLQSEALGDGSLRKHFNSLLIGLLLL